MFTARLGVQLPLYFADETGALGVARLVMGVPLFALAVLFTWLLLSRASSMVDASSSEDDEASPNDAEASSAPDEVGLGHEGIDTEGSSTSDE